MADKIKVTIDGQSVEVEPGTMILNAARQIGGDIVPPAMCYYSKLKGSGGKCRTCLVKVAQGSEKDPRPSGLAVEELKIVPTDTGCGAAACGIRLLSRVHRMLRSVPSALTKSTVISLVINRPLTQARISAWPASSVS